MRAAGLDVVVYDEVHVEPTDVSFRAAAAFARDGRFDGYLSVGGGSVIDTCKAASLYATYPADLLVYVNAPIGAGRPVPGPLPPHVACPTTCGTGSECTGHRRLRRPRAEGQDGHRLAAPAADARAHRSHGDAVAAGHGRRRERLRRPLPRASSRTRRAPSPRGRAPTVRPRGR